MFQYRETESTTQFHASDKHVKALVGPFGSGKSCAASVEVLSRACQQPPAPDGTRYVRVGVVRATYPKLTATTRRSLIEVLPSECGTITRSGAPLNGFYLIPLADGTTVHLELELIALNSMDASEELRSFSWTFAWLNEATELVPEVYAAVGQRIGRFPSQDAGGVSWDGIIMDFNQPARGTWLDAFMRDTPENMLIVRQPPAALRCFDENGAVRYDINPEAENLRNLGAREEGDPDPETLSPDELDAYLVRKGMRYYRNQIDTELCLGREDKVRNLYCMEDIPIVDGKPVYARFSAERHVAPGPIEPIKFHNIVVGMDQSGIHPAAIVMQNQNNKWCVLDELYAEDEGLEVFLYGVFLPLLRSKYQGNPVSVAIDPSNQRDSWTATTPKRRLEDDLGIPVVDEISNSPKIRIQAVEHMLNLDAGGLLIDPRCELLLQGFGGAYKYRRLRTGGTAGAAYTPTPEKDETSHVHDALQYAALAVSRRASEDDTSYSHIAYALQQKRRALSNIV